MSNQVARTQDPMILFRAVQLGKNSKGGDRVQLKLNNEETQKLINELAATLTNVRGAKIDLHISEKTYQGRTFDSAIAFVKPVAEPPGSAPGAGAPTKFVAKANPAATTSGAASKLGRKIG